MLLAKNPVCRDVYGLLPIIRIRVLRKKQSNKANKTLALERMEGQHGREQLFGCKGIQHASVEQNKGSLMSAYHSFIISRALRSAVKKGA